MNSFRENNMVLHSNIPYTRQRIDIDIRRYAEMSWKYLKVHVINISARMSNARETQHSEMAYLF